MEEGGGRVSRYDPGMVKREEKLHSLMRLVRIEHTLFSLPYAYLGAILAGGRIQWETVLLIFTSLLGLRTAGMAYNEIADLEIDRLNPRSSRRPLVTGAVTLREAYAVVAAGSALYYASAALLNYYAILFSPLLWVIVITYPYAKRYHWLPHLHLGLTLGLAVFGGSVAAVGGEAGSLSSLLSMVPWSLVLGVTLWVAGFDVVYSMMDYEFDKEHGLGSIPARFGLKRAMLIAALLHAGFLLLLLLVIIQYSLGFIAVSSYLLTFTLIALEHYIIWRRGLEGVSQAFNINLAVGLIIGLGFSLDALLHWL